MPQYKDNVGTFIADLVYVYSINDSMFLSYKPAMKPSPISC